MDLLSDIIKTILALAFTTGAVVAAVAIIRLNLKRRDVRRAVRAATSEQIDRIVALIESIGSEPSKGGILINANSPSDSKRCIVHIPDRIKTFPWSGQAFEIKTDNDVTFVPASVHEGGTELLGQNYRFMAIPCHLTQKGKSRNIFDPKRYVTLCPELLSALKDISATYPMEVLSYILCDGRIEFEPINQLRIGTSAAWAQDPEWAYCPTCKKRMALIIQLPGTSIHTKAFHEGTFYLFGCASHPEVTECVQQYT